MNLNLFDAEPAPATGNSREQLGAGAFVLRGFALPYADALLPALKAVLRQAPFRHMVTPGGFRMSVGLSSCGALGWTSDRRGYRYTPIDPDSGLQWPAMPEIFMRLAQAAAAEAGFADFVPDACLINRYEAGSRLSLHQDRNERDLTAPVVSVSLGIPAMFQFGGNERGGPKRRVPLFHGDVVVWGGEDRLRYHAVLPLKPGHHPATGEVRINITFRKAG
ncbi:DNA oxidative demethylase AlkB [Oxalobacteraceae bacterium CAVE-383]|nr:DNA oxidative demethylase AlkB [Oxalobacteraceae bacterium CAVE-383]